MKSKPKKRPTKAASRAKMLTRARALNKKHGGMFAGLVNDIQALVKGKRKAKK